MTPPEKASPAVERVLSRLRQVRSSGSGWTARCPAHDDNVNSLSIGEGEDGRTLLKCHAGCHIDAVIAAIGLDLRDLFAGQDGGEGSTTRNTHATAHQATLRSRKQPKSGAASEGCSLQQYAEAKRLPIDFLQGLGLGNFKYQGRQAVRVPYFAADGQTMAVRFRIGLSGERFRWKSGDKPCLYGVSRLSDRCREIVLVEGESDTQTLLYHDIPALGLPGAASWRDDRDAPHFGGAERILVVIEDDQGGKSLSEAIGRSSIRDRVWLVDLGSHKDTNALYLNDPPNFVANWERAVSSAVKLADQQALDAATEASDAFEQCQQLASSPDILSAFQATLGQVVVGEERAAKLLYLALTSRFFKRPISVAVRGPSSGGKSFLTEQVLNFFPDSAYYALTSMSEHALAYSDEPLRHRFLVIYEVTGMEGDLQSYLIRTLLSEGHIRYETVEKTSDGLKSRLIEREGPTGLLVTTTSLRLHPENETRLLSLTVTDSQEQTERIIRAIAQDAADDEVAKGIDYTPWHALQTWLAGGNSRAVVPFASLIAREVRPVAVRLRRDLKVVLNLVLAHAVLHQASRERDKEGRVLATSDDYRAVHALVSDLISVGVEATVPENVRETVDLVQGKIRDGRKEVGVRELCVPLGLDRSSVYRRVNQAQERGYLRNTETGKGKPARLVIGEPMPHDIDILPSPERLYDLLRGCARSEGRSNPSPLEAEDGVLDIERAAIMANDGDPLDYESGSPQVG